MKSNIIYNRLDISIKKGSKDFSQRLNLDKGICVGVRFIPFTEETKHSVNLGLEDNSGTVLVTQADYRMWKHTGAGFFEGMVQVNFETNNNSFVILAKSSKELENDFEGQIIFAIERQ